MAFSDELYEQLSSQPTHEEVEYRPHTWFDGVQGELQTGPVRSGARTDFNEILEQFGYDPTKVQIVGRPRVSRWQQRARKRVWNNEENKAVETHEFETVWLEAYKFQLAAVGQSISDLEAIVRAHKETRPPVESAPYWFVFQAGDQQLGKRSRDGSTEEIITRYLCSVDNAKRELKAAKHLGVAGVQISMPGDCLEGNQSQGGKNFWLTQETITEQTRILRRLMMYTVEEFAPLAGHIYLDVVNGNHDQAQRDPVSTYPGDGWATEQAIAVQDALKMNPTSFGHVEVRVPEKWSGFMTVPVGDTIVTVIHGHQWTRAQGPMRWWEQQAINCQPPGAAQIIQHGHWHELQLRSNAHRMAIGTPTYDCGSDWYREKTGATSRRGGLTYLLRGGEVSRMTLV